MNKKDIALSQFVSGNDSLLIDEARERNKNRSFFKRLRRIALQVLEALDDLNISPEEFAKRMNVHPQLISNITKGKEDIPLETLLKIENIIIAQSKIVEVPEKINIYTSPLGLPKSYGDGLFIGSTNSKQNLGYHNGTYYIIKNRDTLYLKHKVKCLLIPYEREDFKTGDTAFISGTSRLTNNILVDITRYVKIIDDSVVRFNENDEVIIDKDFHYYYYKIVLK